MTQKLLAELNIIHFHVSVLCTAKELHQMFGALNSRTVFSLRAFWFSTLYLVVGVSVLNFVVHNKTWFTIRGAASLAFPDEEYCFRFRVQKWRIPLRMDTLCLLLF